jgi:site-specific recombinase XerD
VATPPSFASPPVAWGDESHVRELFAPYGIDPDFHRGASPIQDRAMVLGMLVAGLRRCEVLGLRFCDVQVAGRRLAVVEGKGGHHRIVLASNRFFDAALARLCRRDHLTWWS